MNNSLRANLFASSRLDELQDQDMFFGEVVSGDEDGFGPDSSPKGTPQTSGSSSGDEQLSKGKSFRLFAT
jgi:hypothetical protein